MNRLLHATSTASGNNRSAAVVIPAVRRNTNYTPNKSTEKYTTSNSWLSIYALETSEYHSVPILVYTGGTTWEFRLVRSSYPLVVPQYLPCSRTQMELLEKAELWPHHLRRQQQTQGCVLRSHTPTIMGRLLKSVYCSHHGRRAEGFKQSRWYRDGDLYSQAGRHRRR